MDTNQKLMLMMTRFVNPNSKFAEQVYFPENYTRSDGSVRKKGTYFFPVRSGSCTHIPKHKKLRDCPDCVELEFSRKHLRQHLSGAKTYAPYQLSDDNHVKWICLDVDSYDDIDDVLIRKATTDIVKEVNKLLGKGHCLVEKSGSKGYHIWLFFEEPVKADAAFSLGHMIKSEVTTVSEIIIEVFPKQTGNKLFGNTVKLPLGVHQKTGDRCFFVKGDFTTYEDQWEVLAGVKTVSQAWINDHIKVIEKSTSSATPSGSGQKAYVPLCLTDIMRNGCGEGIRDEAAFRIACYYRDKDYPEYMAEAGLDEWNSRNQPPLEKDVLEVKIDSAYSSQYSWRPCHLPGLDPYCHSECTYFDRKVEQRWFKKDASPVGVISRD